MVDEGPGQENLISPLENLSDAERKVSLALTSLQEMLYIICNHLGSPIDVDGPVKQTPTSKKVDIFGNPLKETALGNATVPFDGGHPNEPRTISKPKNYLTKSRDFTGRSISIDDDDELEKSTSDLNQLHDVLEDLEKPLLEAIEKLKRYTQTTRVPGKAALTPNDMRN